MAEPCLPFCHWPTFTDPCDNIAYELVCCIKWTMPCPGTGGEVTCTFDAGVFTDGGSTTYAEMRLVDGAWQLVYLTENELCQTVRQGKIFWASNAILGDDPEIVLYPEDYAACDNGLAGTVAPDIVADPYGYTASGCTGWPDRLTEISGLEETVEEETYTIQRRAFPGIRWSCQTGGMILFEVGWCVWDVIDYISPAGRCVEWNSFVPISTGRIDSEWYLRADPFSLDGVEETEFAYSSTVTPVVCNYEPCGDPLDCFASCISGSKDCDGMTPAHAPVIYITFSSDAGCCLNGTFTMRYSGNAASSGCGGGGGGYTITDPPSCEIAGCTYTLCATLSCAKTPLTDGVDYGAGSNFAHLYIKIVDGGGCEMQSFSYVLGMSCSGGLLSNRSGTMVLDSVCGDAHETDMDWVLHG